MPVKEVIDKISFSPRVSFWLSLVCLAIVLLNNHVYLRMLETTEKKQAEGEIKIQARESALVARERILRLWEVELISKGGQCLPERSPAKQHSPDSASR